VRQAGGCTDRCRDCGKRSFIFGKTSESSRPLITDHFPRGSAFTPLPIYCMFSLCLTPNRKKEPFRGENTATYPARNHHTIEQTLSFQSFFLCESVCLMNPSNLSPEDILPHRDGMLLVGSIIDVNDSGAVTWSVVSDKWPFSDGQKVRAIVLIELVAQTAGIHNGWIREKKYGPTADKKGWIVGIRQARLAVDAIPLNTGLIARTENRMVFDGFRDIYGSVEWESNIIAEIMLQLLRSDVSTDASG